MIFDSLTNLMANSGPVTDFAKELDFLRSFDGTPWEGRREIRPGTSYALYQAYQTKPLAAATFEAHRKWIDLQFVWQGRESILHAQLSRLGPAEFPYDSKKDAALWSASMVSNSSSLLLEAGDLAVFFPSDVHAPGLEIDGIQPVVKVVVKVAMPPSL